MTDRQTQAVIDAIKNSDAITDEEIAVVAIPASDAKYIKGLVDALKAGCDEAVRECILQFDCASLPYWEGRASAFEEALASLPEDLRNG